MNKIIIRYFKNTQFLFIYKAEQRIPITLKGQHATALWELIKSERTEENISTTVNNFIKNHAKSGGKKRVSRKSFKDIWRIIRNEYEKNSKPMSCFLEVTARCNFACVHCYLRDYASQSKKELDFSEVANVLKWLREQNVYKITFSGGEPFARGDFFRILELAKSMNFSIHIFSNIALLNHEKIEQLEQLGVSKIDASIYAFSEDTYKRITGSDSRSQVYSNLKQLIASSIDVVAKTPILRDNSCEIKAMAEVFEKLGVRYIVDPLQIQSGYFSDFEDNVFCDLPLLEQTLDDIQYQWTFKTDRSDPLKAVCGGGSRNLMIDAYGGVHPCASLRIDGCNLRKSSIDAIWNGKALREHHDLTEHQLTRCRACSYRSICYFCPGRAKLCTGDMKNPPENYCLTVKLLEKFATEMQ